MAARFELRRLGLALAAPLLAVVFAAILTSIVLLIAGDSPSGALRTLVDAAKRPRIQVQILNLATLYYLSAIAVAIGFRMNLFNIGVDGQYRLAALMAAEVGGVISLPAPLHVTVILLTAIDETFVQTVHARSSYKPKAIHFGHKFASIYNEVNDGEPISIDVRKLSAIEPA